MLAETRAALADFMERSGKSQRQISRETGLAGLGEVLWDSTAIRGQEDVAIMEKYRDSIESLMDSFNPKQKKWFEAYQEMVADELILAERRRFVCGFKTAMRLALESMK